MRVLLTPAADRDDRRQDGAAAVELALLLPVLVMLLFGVIQFGIIFAQELGVGNGAREGARFAATTPGITCPEIEDITQEAATTVLVAPTDVIVDVYVGPDRASAVLAGLVCPGVGDPCDASGAGDNVYVVTTFQASLFIPFVINRPVFELEGNGGFACEFS